MTQENKEKKKEKRTVLVGKMNIGSSMMKSVKNGAVRVLTAGLVNPHKKTVTSNVKHFHMGEIGVLGEEKKKFIKFDCEIDNIKVNFELNDVTDGVQKNAKKLKDDFKKTEQEKLGSALGCKFKVISIYGYDQEGKRIKIGEVRNGGKKIKIDHKSLKEAGLNMTDLEKVLVGTGLAQEQAFSKLKEKIEKLEEKEAQESKQKKTDEQDSEQEEQAQQKEKTQEKEAEQSEEKFHEKEQEKKEAQENTRAKSGQPKQGDSFDYETSRTIKETMDYLRKELREVEERLKDTDYTSEEKQGLEAHKQGLRETYETFESANKKLSSLRTTKSKIKDKKVKTASRTETETDKNVKEAQTVDKVNDNKEKNSERFQYMQEEAEKKSRADNSAVHQENEEKSERMKVMEENAKKNTMNSHQARTKDHKMKR